MRRALSTLALAVAVLLLANTGFLAIRLADGTLPRASVEEALRTAYFNNTLSTSNYAINLLLGIDQYTDCTTMQIAVLGNTPLIRNALAPRLASEEGIHPDEADPPTRYRCRELHSYLDRTAPIEAEITYTRFWHGQSTLLVLALQLLPLDGYRALLLNLTLALIALVAVLAALRGRSLLLTLAPLLAMSFLLGGQFGFGQLASHAPAHLAIWSMSALLIAQWDRLSPRAVLLLAVLAGALEAFLDMMISTPLAASVFLIVTTSLSLNTPRPPGFWTAARITITRAAAWVFGLAGSYALKLLLTAGVLGWTTVFGPFLVQLRFRTGLLDPQAGLPLEVSASWASVIFSDIMLLGNEFSNLGYGHGGSGPDSGMIALGGLIGWIWLITRAVRATRAGRLGPFLAAGTGYFAAALLFLAWVGIFPEHTWRHTWFMVRSAMVWIIGGWGWAMTDAVLTRSAAKSAAAPSPPPAGRIPR